MVGAHGVNRVRDLAAPPDRSAQSFAAALVVIVDRGELIESWEWQLDVLVDLLIHHPDDIWVGRYTAQIFGGVPVRQSYRWQEQTPAYLIDGPFSKFTGLYRGELAADCCTLVTSNGAYEFLSRAPSRKRRVRAIAALAYDGADGPQAGDRRAARRRVPRQRRAARRRRDSHAMGLWTPHPE